MWLSKACYFVYRVIGQISRWAHGIGAGILAVMMFLTFTDVTLRYVFNRPIAGSYELSEYMMAIVVAFGLAYCAMLKGHVTIDLVVSRFPQRAQAIIGSVTSLLSLGVVLLMTLQTALFIKEQFDSGLTSTVLLIPAFPFVGAVALGSALFCLVLLTWFVEFLSQAVRK